jgi:hypothetical protein
VGLFPGAFLLPPTLGNCMLDLRSSQAPIRYLKTPFESYSSSCDKCWFDRCAANALTLLLLLQAPPTPPVDPENEEFVIFVRSKKVTPGHLLWLWPGTTWLLGSACIFSH